MRTLAVDNDLERVERCHHRTVVDRKMSARETRPVVQTEHRVAREALEESVFDHHPATGRRPLFRWLKNHIDRAAPIGVAAQRDSGAEQHRRMAVMAARMHLALVLRPMLEAV